jgi:hypothetical protein
MEAAARLTLDYPLTFETIGEELPLFDGWALRGLAEFRLRCARDLASRLKSFSDCQNGPSKIWAGCPSASGCNPPKLPQWLGGLFYSHTRSDWFRSEYDFDKTILTSVQFRDEFLDAFRGHIDNKDCHFCLKVYTLKGEAYCADMCDIPEQARKVPLLTSGV